MEITRISNIFVQILKQNMKHCKNLEKIFCDKLALTYNTNWFIFGKND